MRADLASCREISELVDVPTFRIQMQEPHIHLDTLFGSLRTRKPLVLVCRHAFAEQDSTWNPLEAWGELRDLCDRDCSKLLAVSRRDGVGYATNIRQTTCGRVIVPTGLSDRYVQSLQAEGYILVYT